MACKINVIMLLKIFSNVDSKMINFKIILIYVNYVLVCNNIEINL